MRRQISSKPNTCTEGVGVDAADISAEVSAHYPGRSVDLPIVLALSIGGAMGQQKSAEAIVGPRLDRPKGRTEDEERKLFLR